MLRQLVAFSLAVFACGNRAPGSCADAARSADCPTRVEAGRVDAGSPLSELDAIAPSKRASLLVLPSDPLLDPAVLTAAEAVYVDGVRVGP